VTIPALVAETAIAFSSTSFDQIKGSIS